MRDQDTPFLPGPRVSGPKSCRRPVKAWSHASKSYCVNRPLDTLVAYLFYKEKLDIDTLLKTKETQKHRPRRELQTSLGRR